MKIKLTNDVEYTVNVMSQSQCVLLERADGLKVIERAYNLSESTCFIFHTFFPYSNVEGNLSFYERRAILSEIDRGDRRTALVDIKTVIDFERGR